jgi:hypothetical protein
MAVEYTRLKHLDGREQVRPTAGFERNRATYEAAGWRVDPNQDGATPEKSQSIRIVSAHNEERVVSASDYEETFKGAGWRRADEVEAEKAAAKAAAKKG